MSKKILVYASFGEGHKIAALALKDFLDAEVFDLLDFSPKYCKTFFKDSYLYITQNAHFFWKFLFNVTKSSVAKNLIKQINLFFSHNFLNYLYKNQPDLIVATHFFPLYFFEDIKKRFSTKIFTIVTDLIAHPLWVNETVDLYFVASEYTKYSLVKQKVATEKIISGYVPLREGFILQYDKNKLRQQFKLDNKPVLLFMSSLRGNFPFLRSVLKKICHDFNIFIICGRNQKLANFLKEACYPNVIFFNSYQRIWELMNLSSVIITKPGGLTIFEGLYLKKTFIFTSFIAGQEEDNMKLLARYNIARFAKDINEFLKHLDYFVKNLDKIQANYPLIVKDIRSILKDTLIV